MITFLKSRLRSLKAALLLSFILSSFLTGTAAAHLDLVQSQPADGDILETSPKFVQMRFNEALDMFESSVVVFNSDGSQVDMGDARVNPENRTKMQVSLADKLPPGVYTVNWVAVDDQDGHPSEGGLEFTIWGTLPQSDQPRISYLTILLSILLGGGIVVSSVWLFVHRKRNN
jgi:hypothetical protein